MTDLMPTDTQERYRLALEELMQDIERDSQIVAAILLGSLSHDTVWERSDIDLILVTADVKLIQECVSMLKRDVIIHASLVPRTQFRKLVGSAVQSSFAHSMLTRGRVLFSRDPAIVEFFHQPDAMGARDRQTRLLAAGTCLLPTLTKAEKWFTAKKDYRYAYFYVTKMVDTLATIEVVWNSGNPGREVIQQAIALNPSFFNRIYTELSDLPKNEATVGSALEAINGYVLEKSGEMFKPVFDYLHEAGGVRSATELDFHFANQMNVEFVSAVCEWLSDHGFVQRVGVSRRLTEKSRCDVEAAGFYYEHNPAAE